MLGATREAACGGHAKRRDFPRIRAGPASRALAGRRHNNNPLRASLDARALRRSRPSASPYNHRFAARWTLRACVAAAGFAGAWKQAPRLASGSGFDLFTSCSLRRLRSQQARRLRCASRRRRLALASRRASRHPPANRRCRSRGLQPLGGPPLRSAPSAPSLAFASALLPGRAERVPPAPALRRLNTERRLPPPALASHCARQKPAPRVAGRSRFATASAFGLAWKPPMRGSLDASRLRGGSRRRRRLKRGSAPRLRLGLRPLHQLLPPQAPVATGSTSPLRAATAAPGARFASRFTAPACKQALPLSRPLAARRSGPALGAYGPFAGVRWRSLTGPTLTRRAGADGAAPEHRRVALAARARFALRETETRFAARWTRRACAVAAGFTGAWKQDPRLAFGSGFDIFTSCSLRRLRSQQARRLRSASRRWCLVLAPRSRLSLALARF